jgi:hypothetical protein
LSKNGGNGHFLHISSTLAWTRPLNRQQFQIQAKFRANRHDCRADRPHQP